MRIGYDAKRAIKNFTGLGNYSRSLIELMLKTVPENEYYLYTPMFTESSRLDFLKKNKNVHIVTPDTAISKTLSSSWRSYRIAANIRKDKVNIYHGLSHELPFNVQKSNAKSVVTIHDLIFLRYPEFYNFFDRQIYKAKFQHSCQVADQVVAISEQTKQDIVNFLSIDEKKITVIPPSCNTIFEQAAGEAQKEAVRKKYSLPQDYVLFVSTIEYRKNLNNLILALKQLTNDVKLVVVGKHGSHATKIKKLIVELGLSEQVVFAEKVNFADLPAIYQMAEVFVYPSLFEGFGLPIIEAMYSKVPVITSNTSSMPEAAGKSSILIDPEKPAEIAAAIQKVLSDSSLRKTMVAEGLKHVDQFSEKNVSHKLVSLYKSLL
jgi:glycosyltransferase involved in cell wall biosynthesis